VDADGGSLDGLRVDSRLSECYRPRKIRAADLAPFSAIWQMLLPAARAIVGSLKPKSKSTGEHHDPGNPRPRPRAQADRRRGRRRLVHPDWPTGVALGLGGLAGGYTGARIQSRLPDTLIRRIIGVLVIAIGARYLWSGLS
jgi:hypothetical protein